MSGDGRKTIKLQNLCLKIGSGATPRGGKEAYLVEGPFSLIRSQNVLDFSLSVIGIAFISEEQANQLSNVEVHDGDVLLNITGDSVARVCQAPASILPARVNQHVAILRPNRRILLPEYLKYYLLEPKFKNYMLAIASVGGTRNALTKSMIEDFEIEVPDLPTQTRIAAILSALDDKIELNRQTNATLEDIAQAIFKEWFVDFRFPGATGEMQGSELGPIPKGWRVGKLGDVVEIKGGTTPSTKNPDYWNGEYNWTTPRDLSNLQFPVLLDTERKITQKGLQQISSGILPKGTLLLSSRAPIGYLAISQIPVSINQGYIAIQGNLVSNLFMLYWLQQNMAAVKERANGSTFLEINKSNFREIDIVLPSKNLLRDFDVLASPIFKNIVKSEIENVSITQIRDTLLPKLMNGEISVGTGSKPALCRNPATILGLEPKDRAGLEPDPTQFTITGPQQGPS